VKSEKLKVKSGYFGGSDTFTGLENFSGTSIAAAVSYLAATELFYCYLLSNNHQVQLYKKIQTIVSLTSHTNP